MQHVDFTVRPQSIGGTVRLLRELLGVTATGIYDEATESRVRSAQRKSGLPVTGVCDEATWAAVRAQSAKPAPRVEASKKAGA